MRRLTTGLPLGRDRTSGSAPRLPTKITLFTLPDILCHLVSYPPDISGLSPARHYRACHPPGEWAVMVLHCNFVLFLFFFATLSRNHFECSTNPLDGAPIVPIMFHIRT